MTIKSALLVGLGCILMNISIASNAGTVSCGCDPIKVYAGFTGGNGSVFRVDCADGKNYPLGLVNNNMTKERYSGALSALMSKKAIVIQYWDSSNLSCNDVSNNWSWVPAGFWVE